MISFPNLIYLGRRLLEVRLQKESQERDFSSGFVNRPTFYLLELQLPLQQKVPLYLLLPLYQVCFEDQIGNDWRSLCIVKECSVIIVLIIPSVSLSEELTTHKVC